MHEETTPACRIRCARGPAGALARLCATAAALSIGSTFPALAAGDAGVADLSIEELRDVVVSSVARHDEPLLQAAASVYVISGDEIRRLGLMSLPEALRLAPNLQVAQVDSRQWAITARGFNSTIANKLLVLVDGRTVYSPLFSGVFWDQLDFVPADIDRIEVLSGPAGAAWGTNAVNGVINIVNKPATATQGLAGTVVGAARERAAWAHAGYANGALAWRLSGRVFGTSDSLLASGMRAGDASSMGSLSLRVDWDGEDGTDHVALDAGRLREHTSERPFIGGDFEGDGAHARLRWTHRIADDEDVEVQAWDDSIDRSDGPGFHLQGEVSDLEARWRLAGGDHHLLLGAGWRRSQDHVPPGQIAFVPDRVVQHWASLFVQDEWRLAPGARLTLGERLEHNPYTGWESLPDVRLSLALRPDTTAWGALSRATRSPARLDRDLAVPGAPPYALAPNAGFESETANVLEAGVRHQLGNVASVSATAFVARYDKLRSVEPVAGVPGQYTIGNGLAGTVKGLEAWGSWQPHAAWRLDAGALWLDESLHRRPGSQDPVGPSNLGDDPRWQATLRSTNSLADELSGIVTVRHVGRLPSPAVPAYTAVDLQLDWKPAARWRVGAGVRNAFAARHVEFDAGNAAPLAQAGRSAFVLVSVEMP